MATLDLRNRSPEVSVLPDLRLRVTRVYDVLNWAPKTPAQLAAEVQLPWGTADETYSACLLIKQDVSGQEPAQGAAPFASPPHLTRVFETIDPSLETGVGNSDVSIDQAGIYTITQEYLQFSTGTAIYQVPGTTPAPAPWNTTCVLKDEQRTDDGTLRRIKRT